MVIPSGLVVLTDRRSAARPLAGVVAAAVRGGAGWVVLRERDLGYAERRALADELRSVVPPGRLIVAGADPLGGDAVHLAAREPLPAGLVDLRLRGAAASPTPALGGPEITAGVRQVSPLSTASAASVRLVGRSCHSAAEVAAVSVEDYVTVSPVYPSRSKPGYGPALTPAGAGRLAGDVPWLALGGVETADQVRECRAAGASGVAVMGAVMRAGDPERLAAELAGACVGRFSSSGRGRQW